MSKYLVDMAQNSEGERLQLTHCPACEEPFFVDWSGGGTRIYNEDSGELFERTISILIDHHISTHDAGDFGITGEEYRAGDNIGAEPDLREVVV